MEKKITIMVGLVLLTGIMACVIALIRGVESDDNESLTIGSYYPYTYSGVVKEIIDDNTVIVEQTKLGDSIGGLIEVTYDELDVFDTFTVSYSSKVTLSVGDEVWFSLWSSSDLTEKEGKRYIKTDGLSVNEGGRLCYGYVKEIIDDNTLLVTEFPEENPEIASEFIIHFDKYELLESGDNYVEIEPELGDGVHITYNEEDVDKSGEQIRVECIKVRASSRENIGPEDILFITEYMWLEGEVVEIVNDNTMIVKASSENEHINKGDKVKVKYKYALREKIEVPREISIGDKVSVAYYSCDVESIGEDVLTALRVEIFNEYECLDGYVLKQRDENSAIVWIDDYSEAADGYFAIVKYDKYYDTIITEGNNIAYYEYEKEYKYDISVKVPREEEYIRLLCDKGNIEEDGLVVKIIEAEMITAVEWK